MDNSRDITQNPDFTRFLETINLQSVTDEIQLQILYSLYKFVENQSTSFQKNAQYMDNIKALENELDIASFDYGIPEQEKYDILELYKLWKKSLNNKIIIEDLNGLTKSFRITVKITDRVTINGIDFGVNVNTKSTIHFINCKCVNILVSTKLNHITLEKCENLNINVKFGSISGVDSIRCKNVSHVFDNAHINWIDVSNSANCKYFLPEKIALNTIVSTMESLEVELITLCDDNHSIKDRFETCKSFFDVLGRYTFEKESDTKVILKDISDEISNINLLNNLKPVIKRHYYEKYHS